MVGLGVGGTIGCRVGRGVGGTIGCRVGGGVGGRVGRGVGAGDGRGVGILRFPSNSLVSTYSKSEVDHESNTSSHLPYSLMCKVAKVHSSKTRTTTTRNQSTAALLAFQS